MCIDCIDLPAARLHWTNVSDSSFVWRASCCSGNSHALRFYYRRAWHWVALRRLLLHLCMFVYSVCYSTEKTTTACIHFPTSTSTHQLSQLLSRRMRDTVKSESWIWRVWILTELHQTVCLVDLRCTWEEPLLPVPHVSFISLSLGVLLIRFGWSVTPWLTTWCFCIFVFGHQLQMLP